MTLLVPALPDLLLTYLGRLAASNNVHGRMQKLREYLGVPRAVASGHRICLIGTRLSLDLCYQFTPPKPSSCDLH